MHTREGRLLTFEGGARPPMLAREVDIDAGHRSTGVELYDGGGGGDIGDDESTPIVLEGEAMPAAVRGGGAATRSSCDWGEI